MKNRKTAKFILTVLSVALLLSAAFAVSTLAENSAVDDATPVIASKNVSYEGTLHLYYAIPKTSSVTAENTTLSIYDADPDAGEANLIGTYKGEVERIDMLDGEYIVIRTGGIASKDMAKYVYAQAESAGNKSKVCRYSVLEYLYERLYVGTHTSVQKKLYESTIQYGIAAQEALTNYPLQVETPIDQLVYVYIDPKVGTLDGKHTSGLYLADTTFELDLPASQKPAEGYGVTTVSTGECAELRDTSFTAEVSSVIGKFKFNGETFDGYNLPATDVTAVGKVELSNQITADFAYAENSSDHKFGITADPENALNNVLYLRRNATGSEGNAAYLYITPEAAIPDYNAIVFEANLKIDYVVTGTIDLLFKNGSDTGLQICLGTDDTTHTHRVIGKDVSTVYTSTGVAKGDWFNLRVEYYILDAEKGITITILYINNKAVQTVNYTAAESSPIDLTQLQINGWGGVYFDMYMDNMAFKKVKKDFPAVSYDFENGTLPSGMTPYYYDSTEKTNKDSNYTVDDGKLTLVSGNGTADIARFLPTEQYKSFGNETINSWVFEADMKINGISAGNGQSKVIFRDNSVGSEYSLVLGLRTGAGQAIWFGNGNTSQTTAAMDGTDFRLRLEYYIDESAENAKPAIRIYVNGVYQATYSNDFKYLDTAKTKTNMPALDKVNQFRIFLDQTAEQTLVFDNVRFFTAYTENPS